MHSFEPKSSAISFLLSFLACKVLRASIYTDQAYNNSKSRDSFQLPYDETDSHKVVFLQEDIWSY